MGILLPSLSVRRSRRQPFCLRLLALLLLLACATPFSSSAQTPAGSIIGTVSEQHAGPLAGARVSVTSVQSGATSSIATDVNGRFTVEKLAPRRLPSEDRCRRFCFSRRKGENQAGSSIESVGNPEAHGQVSISPVPLG